MKNTRIVDNQIYFSRQGELIKLSSCGENTIRFQGFPDGKEIQENYTLLPGTAPVTIEEGERHISMRCGTMQADLWENGKLTVYCKENKILEEKPEMTFDMGFRRYENKGSGLWGARVTFEPNEGEHFFGLGHSWDNEFDLKGSSVDIRNINAKCTIPFVYSSLGYGFFSENQKKSSWFCENQNELGIEEQEVISSQFYFLNLQLNFFKNWYHIFDFKNSFFSLIILL